MKKEYAVFNLKEAKDHLEEIIEILEKSRNIEPLKNGSLNAYFQELYWHINKIWNGRNISQDRIDNSNDEAYDKLCQFPNDLDL